MELQEIKEAHPKCASCKYLTEYDRRDTRFEFIEVDVPIEYCSLLEIDIEPSSWFYCARYVKDKP